ncbi:hypothetical protein AMECASPLE_010613, partial [Ameca splendens]
STPNREMFLGFIYPHPPVDFSLLAPEKVGGEGSSLEVCLIPAVDSAPHLLWLETGRLFVSFCLNHLSLHSGPLCVCISYLCPHHCSAQPPSQGKCWEKPMRGFYQEDNDQKSSLQSFFIAHYLYSSKTNTVEYICFNSGCPPSFT